MIIDPDNTAFDLRINQIFDNPIKFILFHILLFLVYLLFVYIIHNMSDMTK